MARVQPPRGLPVRGDPRQLEISATSLAGASRGCPARTWLDARPGLRPDLADWSPHRSPAPFFLDRVSEPSVAPDTSGLHPGVAEFVRYAAESYAEVLEARWAELGQRCAPCNPRVLEGGRRRLRAWAAGYDSADRSVREVHRLRFGRAPASGEETLRWAAVAAKLAVDGTREGQAAPDPLPARVVVVEVGLEDASSRVVFDGDAAAARARYDECARPAIEAVLSANDYLPGRACGDCRWVSACPALPRLPGLLGLPGEPGAGGPGSVSASDLVAHARCPAEYFLSRLVHLPAAPAPSAPRARGIAVHAWLAAAHGAPAAGGCRELPEDEELRPFVADHLVHCPSGRPAVSELEVEPPVYAYDPQAGVVIAARPDLAFSDAGRRVWRETKTVGGPLPPDRLAALAAFPAAALDLLLLAGLAGPGALLELELLDGRGGALFSYPAADPAALTRARAEVSRLARTWQGDRAYQARPGPHCAGCGMRRWCPDGRA